jgi:hypothetical protein
MKNMLKIFVQREIDPIAGKERESRKFLVECLGDSFVDELKTIAKGKILVFKDLPNELLVLRRLVNEEGKLVHKDLQEDALVSSLGLGHVETLFMAEAGESKILSLEDANLCRSSGAKEYFFCLFCLNGL